MVAEDVFSAYSKTKHQEPMSMWNSKKYSSRLVSLSEESTSAFKS